MSPSLGRRLLSLILAALVLAGGTAPRAQRHSHAGGETPHTHRSGPPSQDEGHCARVQPRHGHCHCTRHANHGEERPSASAPVLHYHVWWLGFEFHLPAFPYEDELQGDDLVPGTRVVKLTGDSAPGKPHCTIARSLAAGSDALSRRLGTEQDRPLRMAGFAPGLPPPHLCDRARHERSGVQVV